MLRVIGIRLSWLFPLPSRSQRPLSPRPFQDEARTLPKERLGSTFSVGLEFKEEVLTEEELL